MNLPDFGENARIHQIHIQIQTPSRACSAVLYQTWHGGSIDAINLKQVSVIWQFALDCSGKPKVYDSGMCSGNMIVEVYIAAELGEQMEVNTLDEGSETNKQRSGRQMGKNSPSIPSVAKTVRILHEGGR